MGRGTSHRSLQHAFTPPIYPVQERDNNGDDGDRDPSDNFVPVNGSLVVGGGDVADNNSAVGGGDATGIIKESLKRKQGAESNDDDDADKAYIIKDSKQYDRDLNLCDGKWAPDFIRAKVTKYYQRNKKTYHWTVTYFKIRRDLKLESHKIKFVVLFDEDNEQEEFFYKDLVNIMDDEQPDVAMHASDLVDKDKGDYMPDIVSTRKEMLC